MRTPVARIVAGLALTLVLGFVVNVGTRADDSANLYKAKCSACHAPDGSGNVPMGKQLGAKDLRSDEVQKKTDAELNDSITNGMGKKMPAYKGKLTDDQIKQLVSYIRDLGKKK